MERWKKKEKKRVSKEEERIERKREERDGFQKGKVLSFLIVFVIYA